MHFFVRPYMIRYPEHLLIENKHIPNSARVVSSINETNIKTLNRKFRAVKVLAILTYNSSASPKTCFIDTVSDINLFALGIE